MLIQYDGAPQCRYTSRRGLSLVECLVTIVILAVGIIAGVQCLNSSLSLSLKTNRIALATALADRTLDDVRTQYPDGYIEQMNVDKTTNPNITVSTNSTTNTTVVTQKIPAPTQMQLDRVPMPNGTITVTISPYTDANVAAIAGKVQIVTVDVSWAGVRGREHAIISTFFSNHPSL